MKTQKSPFGSADTMVSLVASNDGKKSAKLAKKMLKAYIKDLKASDLVLFATTCASVEGMLDV